jgi:hypothetical protein
MAERQGSELVISYMTLRQWIGVLGVSLPLVVVLGGLASSGPGVRDSISAYYHSNMRDVFVGLLCMVGVFLLSYKGHDALDRALSALGGLFALGVAAFPTIRIEEGPPAEIAAAKAEIIGTFLLHGGTSRIIHYVCAVALFLSLASISFQFTRTKDKALMTPQKKKRNVVYLACGAIMLGAMALVPLFSLPGLEEHRPMTLILVVEAICLGAFGISWLVKGEAILGDGGDRHAVDAEPMPTS